MDLATAKLQNLDVYIFPAYRQDLQNTVANTNKLQGRLVHEFPEYIGSTLVLCVAVGPRPGAGKIAKDMKRRKAAQCSSL
jgi:hypothetical protein